MKDSIKVKCPAKINLTLEIVNRRDDGFHNIKSIMHFVNLYDYLSIKISSNNKKEIILDEDLLLKGLLVIYEKNKN